MSAADSLADLAAAQGFSSDQCQDITHDDLPLPPERADPLPALRLGPFQRIYTTDNIDDFLIALCLLAATVATGTVISRLVRVHRGSTRSAHSLVREAAYNDALLLHRHCTRHSCAGPCCSVWRREAGARAHSSGRGVLAGKEGWLVRALLALAVLAWLAVEAGFIFLAMNRTVPLHLERPLELVAVRHRQQISVDEANLRGFDISSEHETSCKWLVPWHVAGGSVVTPQLRVRSCEEYELSAPSAAPSHTAAAPTNDDILTDQQYCLSMEIDKAGKGLSVKFHGAQFSSAALVRQLVTHVVDTSLTPGVRPVVVKPTVNLRAFAAMLKSLGRTKLFDLFSDDREQSATQQLLLCSSSGRHALFSAFPAEQGVIRSGVISGLLLQLLDVQVARRKSGGFASGVNNWEALRDHGGPYVNALHYYSGDYDDDYADFDHAELAETGERTVVATMERPRVNLLGAAIIAAVSCVVYVLAQMRDDPAVRLAREYADLQARGLLPAQQGAGEGISEQVSEYDDHVLVAKTGLLQEGEVPDEGMDSIASI